MLKKVCNVLIAIVIVCALALVAVLGIPLITGNQLYAVQTGSMQPTYPIGSIVVVKPVDATQVAVGDVVTYEAAGFQTLVTHRVLEIDTENQLFYTKGDNNANVDFYPVPFANIRGTVSYGIPFLGNIVSGIRTPAGILAVLWVVLGVVILLVLPDLVSKHKQIKKEERQTRTMPKTYQSPAQGHTAQPYKAGSKKPATAAVHSKGGRNR
ncbi:signal peptidase I [Ruminococcaceae bacterium OttesenSCG-928-A16]|nr:signal peptidase I [Ruminococcaceae bacterium OttesenSCG-928-A16]